VATYTIYASATNDAWIDSEDISDIGAVQQGTVPPATLDVYTNTHRVGQNFTTNYYAKESFLEFDLTSIPDNESIVSATLSLKTTSFDYSDTDFTIEARQHDWGTTVTTADWVPATSLGSKTLLASWNTSAWTANVRHNMTSEAALLSAISPTGILRMVLCSSRHRTQATPTGEEYMEIQAPAASTSNDPRLIVVTASPTYVSDNGYIANKSTATSRLVPVTPAAITTGQFAVLSFAMDPVAGTVSVTDQGGGNTWRQDVDITNGSTTNGVRLCMFSCKVVNTINPSGINITVSHPSSSVQAATVHVATFGAGSPTPVVDASNTATGSSGTPSVACTTVQADTFIVAALGSEGPSGDSFTADAEFTPHGAAITSRGTSGGAAASNVIIHSGYRIATSAATQTYNPSMTSRLWAAGIVAYKVPSATSRALIGTVNEGADAYHASIEYTAATGAATRLMIEPLAHPGTKTASAVLTLGDGTTTRTVTAVPPGSDTGGHAYLDISADGITVTLDAEGPVFTNVAGVELEASPYAV
jgi:hypothetical protein